MGFGWEVVPSRLLKFVARSRIHDSLSSYLAGVAMRSNEAVGVPCLAMLILKQGCVLTNSDALFAAW
jgi:hypothetical protein